MYVCMYVCMCVCVYICINIYKYIYSNIYLLTYIHTYIYIYIYHDMYVYIPCISSVKTSPDTCSLTRKIFLKQERHSTTVWSRLQTNIYTYIYIYRCRRIYIGAVEYHCGIVGIILSKSRIKGVPGGQTASKNRHIEPKVTWHGGTVGRQEGGERR